MVFQAIAAIGKEEPKPIVLIDQDSDAEATIVEISFGDRLGALLDTVSSLSYSILFRFGCWQYGGELVLPVLYFLHASNTGTSVCVDAKVVLLCRR